MAKALHILLCTDEVLDVSVLPRGSREDWIVNDDTVNGFVGISIDDFLLDIFLFYSPKTEFEATKQKSAKVSLLSPQNYIASHVARFMYAV